MTYCLGIRVDEGLVFASDTRTNAGVDSVSRFRKMFVFERAGERVVAILTAGNLAVTQEVVTLVEREINSSEPERSLMHVGSMFDAAKLVGEVLRTIYDRDSCHLQAHSADFNASFLVGGQIRGDESRLFLVYPAGNFIEASEETPYFQLGETKYGKPILERVLVPSLGLVETAKCALVSFDSTIRANLSVGPPIDLLIYRNDRFRVGSRQRVEEDDPYFARLRQHWGDGLKQVFAASPDPEWASETL